MAAMIFYKQAKALREERATNWEQQKALQAASIDEKRDTPGLTAEEQGTWDRIESRQAQIETELDAVESQIAGFESRAEVITTTEPGRDDVSSQGERAAPDYDGALEDWLRYGREGLSDEQRNMLRCGRPDASGVAPAGGGDYISFEMATRQSKRAEARAQSVGTTTAGGHMVADEFSNRLWESLLSFGGIRQSRVTVLNTATGADLPIPTLDDTSNSGSILAENASASETDLVFGQVVLQSFKYSSDLVRSSTELLTDGAVDVNQVIGGALGTRLARITNEHFTTGTGSSQPRGYVTAASTGVTAASATAFTYAELLSLKHSVDPAYRDGAEWSFNDTTLAAIKQLSIGSADSRPLWAPSIVVGEPSTIDGDGYFTNQSMVDAATTTKPVAYGQMSSYIIRSVVGSVSVLRLSERYAESAQVGFLSFARFDGDSLDSSAVKVLVMA